jgi:branched-chain amino acid transport system substrate-binding protein
VKIWESGSSDFDSFLRGACAPESGDQRQQMDRRTGKKIPGGKMRAALCLTIMLSLSELSAVHAQVSNDVVRIGVLTDLSGVYAGNTGPGSVEAARMAIEDFGGTVLGRPIELISADHQNKPDVGTALARRWFDEQNVDAIVDLPVSSIALAVQNLARERNKVLLISGAGSSEITNSACSPTGLQWTYDSYAQSKVVTDAIVRQGLKKWFFITADYAFGRALEQDATTELGKIGATVLGGVRHPLNAPDFSSFILQAQTSKADVVVLANGGDDTANAIKQADEFGLPQIGQRVAALQSDAVDIRSMGLKTAKGLLLAVAWYWDLNEKTRAFSARFQQRRAAKPGYIHAGVYSAVTHYLNAIKATGGDDAQAVTAYMKSSPINDMFTSNGHLRDDGRMVHDMYLMRVKTPEESKGDWDVFVLVDTVPGDLAFRSLSDSKCQLLKR